MLLRQPKHKIRPRIQRDFLAWLNDNQANFRVPARLGKRQAFGSRHELWCDHLFSPFLDWVNLKLAPANWLVLRKEEGWSCAEFASERLADVAGRIVIPLRTAPAARKTPHAE